MTYINYQLMSPQQRQVFNSTGYADKEYVMSKSEWEDMLEAVMGKHLQDMHKRLEVGNES